MSSCTEILVIEFLINDKNHCIQYRITNQESKLGIQIYKDELNYVKTIISDKLKDAGYVCQQDNTIYVTKKFNTPYLLCEKLSKIFADRQYCNACNKRTIRVAYSKDCYQCLEVVKQFCDTISGRVSI